MNPESQVSSRSGRLHRVQSAYGIPEGAIPLDKKSVLMVQWTTIQHWKPKLDMWPFIHGPGLLAAFGAAGGAVCNAYFRRTFGVFSVGRMGSFIPTVCLPAALGMVMHQLWVSNSLLVGDFSCPLCPQTRAGAIQAGVGAVYPCLLAVPLAIVTARKHYTYPVPKLTQPQEVLQMLRVTGRPFQLTFLGLFCGQFMMGMFIAKKEQQVLNEKLSVGMLPRDPDELEIES